MEGSFLSPPAKFSFPGVPAMLEADTTPSAAASNGVSSKRSRPPRLAVPAGHALFRLLCHSSRIGGVIGKSGAIIKKLQHDTAAKIRVEELPHGGADERVVVVVASNAVNKRIALKTSKREGESVVVSDEEVEVSAAQEAVVRVFERILDVSAEAGRGLGVPGGVVSCRLLAVSGHAGSVIGKGGKVVEKIRKDTGCRIRVLSAEKLSPKDEIVEIEGDMLAVKKALVTVSRCLQDCPLVDRVKMTGNRPLEAIPLETLPDLLVDLPLQRSSVLPPMPASSVNYASGGRTLSIEAERTSTLDSRTHQEEIAFRLLCYHDRVGGVIGKGGTIVRALQNETGASISVGGSVADCDERLITITAMENPESRYSPAQKAVILVFNRCIGVGIEKGPDSGLSKGSPISARLVVPSNQVGCLLGKGGTIISEMRKATGTGIRIIYDEHVPKCASENDAVVQITGELVRVQDALYHVTCRLRDNLFPNRMPNGAATRISSSVITETSPYGRGRDPSSVGSHTPIGVSHNLSKHAITQSLDHLDLSHNYDRPTSPNLWASQWQTRAGVNTRNTVDAGKGPTSVKGGLEHGSGSRSTFVTNATVEILVPENVIGSVYGEKGSNLARLRQISGAKVVVHEPRPGTTDRIVVISGTPDETQAAQSLLQAFIHTGSS
ncbi:KH domain-containing protein [Actinidia chinensis var. chinensis]|uniref:KH domain-containing protein n=1 Tax=Actinidia chinensis var. chinensis TaxID=1590841 RepID=A0A2R6Q691_ACTCC|nr:KH domain-containing protein [Actinidia chinensis var. chinensis]